MRTKFLIFVACLGCFLAGWGASTAVDISSIFKGKASLFGVGVLFLCSLFLAFVAVESSTAAARLDALKNRLSGKETINGWKQMKKDIRKPISIYLWIFRVSFAQLSIGISLILASAIIIKDAKTYANSPFAPIWLIYGVFPWYLILFSGFLCIFYAWLKARQWQLGIFLFENRN